MAFAGHPILDEIKTGFKLRPTKTVDKSKPVFLAEGESDAEISVTKRLNASNGTDEVDSIPKPTASITPRASPKPSPAVSPVAPVVITPGVVPPPPPPPPGSLGAAPPPPPPPPPGGIPPPPPPPMGVAPPPPAPVVKKPITNPKLLNLGGKAVATDEDRGELLKSIQGGFKLRKTVTNDKSGLHVDDELKSKSVKMVTPTAPPPELLAPPKTRSQLSPRGLDSSEDERYLTADDRSASCTPEPEEKPRQFKWACPSEKKEVLKSDFVFEEKNLHITADDLKEEIPKGLAAAKIAKWLQAENTDGAATLPRPSFRASPSPLRGNSPFKEVNNNNSGSMDTLKPKAPSKWAVVETGGLRRPGQGNVPLDKSRETTPQPMRERSCSALDRPVREPVDRAMTASPIERRRSSARAEVPLTVKTDFPSPTSSSDSKQISPLSSASTKATSPASTKPTSSPSSTKPTSSPASTKAAATPSPAKTASSATKPAASPATKASSKPSPISTKNTTPLTIDTDFSSIATSKKSPKKGSMKKKSTATTTKPEIKETPPTPSHKTNGSAYTYKRTERPASPPEPAASLPSPVSSMSSASVPSPSSISPGSTSPDSAPRRRVVNPNFDKVKEKFSGSGSATPSPTPSRPLLKTTNSVRDSPFHSKTNTPSPRGSVSSTKDEAAAVKKAVKEAAASKQKQRVINVPISAPWHTPRESYSSFDYSPRSPRDYTTSLSRDYSRDYTSPRDYSSPRDHYTTSTREYSPRDYSSRDYYPQSEPTDWRPPRDSGDSNRRTRYDPDSYKYSSIHPDDLRRNYRFNIDLSADSPLSLSRR